MASVTVHHGDALDVLASLPDCSVDAVVTDPPYGLEFMGAEWDSFKPSDSRIRTRVDGRTNPKDGKSTTVTPEAYRAGPPFQHWCELWARECLRVLKPGGHLAAFGGTRTYHRLVAGIEDAGFEIRDSIAAWVYASGFPKSVDVSKAIDKAGGNALAFRRFARAYASAVDSSALTHSDVDRHLGIKSSSCYWAREDHRGGMPPRHHWEQVRSLLDLDDGYARLYDAAEREVLSTRHDAGKRSVAILGTAPKDYDVTAPATDDARRWQGWGTALKPAHEPIVLARKPLTGTVAANVQAWGTGALNIDATRVGNDTSRGDRYRGKGPGGKSMHYTSDARGMREAAWEVPAGRWPANVVLSHVPLLSPEGEPVGDACADGCVPGCQVAALDAQSGSKPPSARKARRDYAINRNTYSACAPTAQGSEWGYTDSGGASRFFPVFRYQAKAPARERPKVQKTVLRLRPDLTAEQVEFVTGRLREAGVEVA